MNSAIISEPEGASAVPAPATEQPPQKVKALLVEDNPGDARLIELMLGEEGQEYFSLEHVARLSEAIERLGRGNIGVVLADLSLPDSSGLDTFARLHTAAPAVPIILFSGLNDTSVAVEAVHQGAQDYLVKGQVNGQLLVRAMRYAIERKSMSEQLARYAEELRSKNAQLEADFNMAREIQEIFLPHQYPTFPHSAAPRESAIKFSHRYLPAAAVGGDFFDIFPITDTTAGVFICDVMGHGMRAALVTAIMRGLLEELMPVAADPGKFLTEINRSLHAILRRTREPFLATAFYVVVDVATSEFRFSNGGHPSPILVRRSSGEAAPVKSFDPRHGPGLGLFSHSVYPTCRFAAEPHDLLLLFTDGLYEVTDRGGEEYGQERLLGAIQRRAQVTVDELFDELLEEVQRFSAHQEFNDDVCLVGVRIERTRIQG